MKTKKFSSFTIMALSSILVAGTLTLWPLEQARAVSMQCIYGQFGGMTDTVRIVTTQTSFERNNFDDYYEELIGTAYYNPPNPPDTATMISTGDPSTYPINKITVWISTVILEAYMRGEVKLTRITPPTVAEDDVDCFLYTVIP